jgi:hypothetical protein
MENEFSKFRDKDYLKSIGEHDFYRAKIKALNNADESPYLTSDIADFCIFALSLNKHSQADFDKIVADAIQYLRKGKESEIGEIKRLIQEKLSSKIIAK